MIIKPLCCFFISLFISGFCPAHAEHILVTACNDAYFDSCITLIASAHRTSYEIIDKIIVYSINLPSKKAQWLNKLSKVEVRYFEKISHRYPLMDIDDYYQNPNKYAWKQICVSDASHQEGDLIFWLDAGIILVKPADEIYAFIEKDDIFLVQDEWHNYTWTHQTCAQIMEATDDELKDFQLCSGIQGYKKGGRYQEMMDIALEFNLIKECVHGEKYYDYGTYPNLGPIRGHRHDQSILSILASRYHCPRHDVNIYGQWRSFPYCSLYNSTIWVHRRTYHNTQGLIFR